MNEALEIQPLGCWAGYLEPSRTPILDQMICFGCCRPDSPSLSQLVLKLLPPSVAKSAFSVAVALQRHSDTLIKAPCLVGAWMTLLERCPLMLLQPRILMAAVTVMVPIISAISLDGTTKSPQIAAECISPMTDIFETSPLGLTRRRKQQINVFFFSVWWSSCNHLEIIWRLSKCQDPKDTDS